LSKILPTDVAFKDAFAIATVSNSGLARYYLRSLERQENHQPEPGFIPNDDAQVITLEHVLPKKPLTNWPQFGPDEARAYVRRIGNLALLQASANSYLQSDPWTIKKPVLLAAPFALTKQIGAEANWTSETISRRQGYLAGLALDVWPL
jgi:hypothetical protein